MLSDLGYVEIGMDHFALTSDALCASSINGKLHRNFMGYTAQKTSLMIGLGMSAISDSWGAFAQNVKTVKEYQNLVDQGEIPVFRGHILTHQDLEIRKHILNLMCRFETSWDFNSMEPDLEETLLKELEEDHLIEIASNGVKVFEQGKPFVRNVCMAFDVYLQQKRTSERLFSLTV